MLAAAVLAGLGAALLPATAPAQTPVDVELVLAVDVSQSMDYGEHELQRQGYVAALQHPDVLSAIGSGMYGRIAITYVEWGASQSVRTPWTLVDGAASARAFAATLAAQPIRTIHGTSISGALAFAAGLFEGNGYEGFRRVIDVSGDGPNSTGAPVVPIRDAALAQGLIINGLPIMLREPAYTFYSIPDLDIYYADCVIGGPGSFVLPVDDARQLAEAIRQKLVLEIAGTRPRTTPVAETRREPRVDCLIGEKLRSRWPYP
ncbi:MAG TPA: DUF1194 domain-containing protein [Geminicoccaceae bacterium]|nr:DUF1194 domain-containing protein [Geminicoccaceae bacterium]